jgi:hypothetical protein
VHGLLRICACAIMALALVQIAYLAGRVDQAPSAVGLMTPADDTELISSLHLLADAPGAPASFGDAAAGAPHEHGVEHGVDPVSATLLALDGLVALTVIVLLARRPRARRAGGRSAPRRSREPDAGRAD